MKMYQNKEMQWFMEKQEEMRKKGAAKKGKKHSSGSSLEHVLEEAPHGEPSEVSEK
eukprot:CAMPEP_0168711082 /NCGR_PEP_ID=MMETSP0503-20121227/42974_1 /TAXON_ID=89963 /ORGANISM="Heterocapsa rotundata, Strain SCCAP K-0483" /LENGTH=55 /DNA_ID=CAMNT_0008757443 /DNA_START=21 /DNA_END=185 /DNA_ORIENTATION=-